MVYKALHVQVTSVRDVHLFSDPMRENNCETNIKVKLEKNNNDVPSFMHKHLIELNFFFFTFTSHFAAYASRSSTFRPLLVIFRPYYALRLVSSLVLDVYCVFHSLLSVILTNLPCLACKRRLSLTLT